MSFQKYNVLITGGAGFIGSHLIDELIHDDKCIHITVVDDLSTGNIKNIQHHIKNDKFKFINKKVQDLKLADLYAAQYHVVIHLAASLGVKNIVEDPLGSIKNNICSTESILEMLPLISCKRILFSSTSEVYGQGVNIPFKEDQDLRVGQKPRWTYAASKILDEMIVKTHCEQLDIDYIIMRFFNIVGPRQIGSYGMVLPRFIKAAIDGDELVIFDEGKNVRTFTSVKDCVSVINKLITMVSHHTIYNIGSRNVISIKDLADKVIKLCNSSSRKKCVSSKLVYGSDFDDTEVRIPDLSTLSVLCNIDTFQNLDAIIMNIIEEHDGNGFRE